MRVLIVEDVDDMRELLEQVVRATEVHQVSGSARNGAEARFELLRRRPDLVLLDEILPGESSFDLLDEMRQDEIPVLLMTSLQDRTVEAVPLPPGAIGRIFKPTWKTFDADSRRFKSEIDQVIQQNRGPKVRNQS